MDIKGFYDEHRGLCLACGFWLMLNLLFLILGENCIGFFPFDYRFPEPIFEFDLRNYGFVEFFVYVLFIPFCIYVIKDLIFETDTGQLPIGGLFSGFMEGVKYCIGTYMVFILIFTVLHGIVGLFTYTHTDSWIAVSQYLSAVVCCFIMDIFLCIGASKGFIQVSATETTRTKRRAFVVILYTLVFGLALGGVLSSWIGIGLWGITVGCFIIMLLLNVAVTAIESAS